ncbi:3'-5' exonuclease [uncultured Clostridium sp.]|uniref:3'-5' exonuclease n=1 Tax=uncultured Clostridium sp. TaxID=59620 RepID=UPI00259024A6|nr:3'-5' exonuclease [uncultured Clostridium sp.]
MGYVVIDLEFNRMDNIEKHYPNIYLEHEYLKDIDIESEIIEIGAIKVDQYMKVEGELKVYIKPSIFPVLNPEIINITKITNEDLEKGISFEEAMAKLKEFTGNNILCSWAKDDIAQIIINSHYHKYEDIKWVNKYIDIQEYVTKVIGAKKSLSLKNALTRLNIKADSNLLHDALNDAYFTVQAFKQLYNYRIVKNYIVNNVYDMPAINLKCVDNIKLNYNMIKSSCPKCRRKIILDFDYMPARWRFISIGICSKCHSAVLNEVIVKKTLLGKVIYSEIGSILNEIEYSDYSYRLEKYFIKKEKKS